MAMSVNDGRERLISTLEQLALAAASSRAAEWENVTLASYLEALAAWLKVYERAYENTGGAVPEDVWDIMADAVRAATIYE
jgi:hypothetical protein